ncbi:hypothetical protein L211DRAFT_888728 [Terfezia boudieri ATCC MYA-4762]|uniref:Uncharacterized protein n=1 Tax=Terfezia boudieri ATCC MYA-4762 TaxID=1051890 RepID=A0A3N4LK71_9PEZI|nr:hypothetical protein L211DRAFT_888728 [Terfezia boudieri ATCC MYA-4762]
MNQTLAGSHKSPRYDSHHNDDDFHDRCPDCRLVVKPDDTNADDDLQQLYCGCFPELEDIGSDDSCESSTVTDEGGLLSGNGAPDSPGVGIDLDNALKALQYETIHFSDDNQMLKKENQELKDWRNEMRAQYYILEARLHRRNRTIQEQSYRKMKIIQERDKAVKAFNDLKSELRRQTRKRLSMLDSYSWDLSAAEAQAKMQAYDFERQLKESEKLFEKRVTQIQEENAREVDRLKLLIELRDERIRKQGEEVRCLVENLNAEDALDRQMAGMRSEKRPRSPSPDGSDTNDDPPRGRARLSPRSFSPLCCSSVGIDHDPER